MTTIRPERVQNHRLVIVSVAPLVLAAALAGCGGGGGKTTGGAGSGGSTGQGGAGGSAVCVATGSTGTLSVRITGTPSGAGYVTLTDGSSITTTSSIPLATGRETVTAYLVAEGASRVRLAYRPTVDVESPCIRAGQTTTVNVTYAQIPSSGRLWLGASNTPSPATLLGYAAADLTFTGTTSAAVATNTWGSDGFTFDPYGNVWVLGGTTADPPVARYPVDGLASDGDKTPDIVIDSPSFGSGIPGAKVLAFDFDGNMWVAIVAGDKVVKLAADQLTASGTPTAAVEEAGINAPSGIAFDFDGNMWVAANGSSTVVRIDAAHLTTSGTGADLTITAMTPLPVVGPLTSPLGIAFDATGNLWVNYDGIMARLTPTDLAGTGNKTITPAVQIALGVQALPLGIAFDEMGGLWFADSVGRFGCLSPSQLAASGSNVTPQIVITSPDLGSAGWFALYPAPAFTPLAHALP